ncbi:MAG: hypothetical protein LBC04_02065 [Holosporaceae bacterium]|jgi:hypothetical protein|nr:hypothetical protein [Holosporaceae bacterium]
MDASWVLGDDYQFFRRTAIGRYGVCKHEGEDGNRMWPLGLWDYNFLVLMPFGNTPMAHYLWNTVTCIASLVIFLKLFSVISRKHFYSLSIFYLIILYISPSFLLVNMQVIFAERMLIFLLAVFIYCSFKGKTSQKTKYYAVAIVCACYATYCKEPVFGALAVFAFTNIIFGKLTKKDKVFHWILVANSISYAVCYYFFGYVDPHSYTESRAVCGNLNMIKNIFLSNKLLLLGFLLAIFRSLLIFLKKDYKHIFFDGLLFSSTAYAIAYMLLCLNCPYYFVPCTILIIPVFYYWTSYLTNNKVLMYFILMIISAISYGNFRDMRNDIRHTHSKRCNDMAVVNLVAKKLNDGYKLYKIYDQNRKDFYKILVRGHIYIFERFLIFSPFLRGEKPLLEIMYDFEGSLKASPEFYEKSILFYPQENYESSSMDILQNLQPLKFTTIANIGWANIFACSELKLIDSPFRYKFKQGLVDQRIHFNCFRFLYLAEGAGAVSCTNSPSIKVKLANSYDYEVHARVRLDWNNTFGLNEINVELSVNDHILTTQKIKQNETKTLAVIIAKHQIPSDGVVNIKFTSPQLYTEKDLGMSDKDLKTGLSFIECSISPIRYPTGIYI